MIYCKHLHTSRSWSVMCCLHTLADTLKGKFSCALIRSATAQVCVKCPWSLVSCVFLLWEGQIATERKVGGWEGLPLMGQISWFVVGHTQARAHRSVHARDQITQVSPAGVQEMGFIYLTCWDAPAIAQILLCLSFEEDCQIDSHDMV